MRRTLVLAAVAATVLAGGCAPKEDSSSGSSSTSASCAKGDLALKTKGTLTVGTDSPAYPPWFEDNDPTNGKGYESAVAYSVAEQLGFSRSEVTWKKVGFNSSYAPGPKSFDFDINQISIDAKRAKVVSFSKGYYSAAQAIVAIKGTPAAGAKTLADLKRLKLGAQTGTTSLTAARDDIKPDRDPTPFDDTNVAKRALLNKQVNAIVADLPTAFIIAAVQIPNSVVVGQFQATGQAEEFGLLSEKGSKLTPCLDKAITALEKDGTLAALQKKWLSQSADVPVLPAS